MNFDICNHMLLSNDNSENEPQPGADAPAPLRREFQQALRNTLLSPAGGGAPKSDRGSDGGSVAGGSPRVLSFAERPPPPQDRYTNVLKVGTYYCGVVYAGQRIYPGGGGRCCQLWRKSNSYFLGGSPYQKLAIHAMTGRWLWQALRIHICNTGG